MFDYFKSIFSSAKQKTLDTYEVVSASASQWADRVTSAGSEYYEAAKAIVKEKSDAVDEKYTDAAIAVWELKSTQEQVDYFLNLMPEGEEKQRLMQQKHEARSFFSQHVAPLINKLIIEKKAYDASAIKDVNYYGNFAALPAIPVAAAVSVVAASSAIIYWCSKAFALEEAILNDPSLTAHEKALLISKTGIGGAIRASTPVVLGVAVIGLLYYFNKE